MWRLGSAAARGLRGGEPGGPDRRGGGAEEVAGSAGTYRPVTGLLSELAGDNIPVTGEEPAMPWAGPRPRHARREPPPKRKPPASPPWPPTGADQRGSARARPVPPR